MQTIYHKSIFYPNYLVASLLDISAEELLAKKVTHVIFDLDETLMPKRGSKLSTKYLLHLKYLQQTGLVVCIGSNTRRDISDITQSIGVVAVQPFRLSFKPRRNFYYRIIAKLKVRPEQIAMVGDRIIQDVVGANRAGLTTILVDAMTRPQGVIHRRYLSAVLQHTKKKG